MRLDKIDLLLAALTTAYSTLLEAVDHKETIEPDLTWAEVAIGNALVLLVVMLRIRTQHDYPTWRDYEAAVHRSFVVGGLPVILWQLLQSARRKNRTIDYYLRGDARPHHDSPQTLAAERGDHED